MAKIRNISKSDITVHTTAGAFKFAAGKSVELAAERVKLIEHHGKMYFSDKELVAEIEAEASKVGEEKPAKDGAKTAPSKGEK